MISRPSVTEEEQVDTFNLVSLSEENYIRHRFNRYIVGLAGCMEYAASLALGINGILTGVSVLPAYERYYFAAVAALAGYLPLALAWVPFRYWAAPPVALSVSSKGLDFLLRSGSRIHVPWDRDSLKIELLERVIQHGRGREMNYRIWVMWGRGDFKLLWRRVVPLTYTSEGGLHRILEEARNQHVSVERIDHVTTLSMLPTVSRTAYIITSGGSSGFRVGDFWDSARADGLRR